jgi:hypothetical protein
MNYASVFLVFILGAAAVYWYISGKKFYHGPIVEAQMDEDSQSDRAPGIERKSDKETMV